MAQYNITIVEELLYGFLSNEKDKAFSKHLEQIFIQALMKQSVDKLGVEYYEGTEG